MITAQLKNKLAKSYSDFITKLVLNDNVEVTKFDQSVNESLLTVSFNVPSNVKELRRIQIFNDEVLLSDSTLYVPIGEETLFRYKAEVN